MSEDRRLVEELRMSSVQLIRIFVEDGAAGPHLVIGVFGLVNGLPIPAKSQEVSIAADLLSDFRRILDRGLVEVEIIRAQDDDAAEDS